MTARAATVTEAGRDRSAGAAGYGARVRTVGLTGGIGSGKSTVGALLAVRGAVVLDADRMARDVLAPGTPGLAAVVEEFGPEVLAEDGSLDRPRLGRVVFADAERRARLEAVVHPRVAQLYARALAEHEAAGTPVVVHDVPLLVENGLQDHYDAVVVVAVDPGTQLRRLVALRGMSEADARARIAAQATPEQRLAVATHVLRNDGSPEELAAQVERLWSELAGGQDSGQDSG